MNRDYHYLFSTAQFEVRAYVQPEDLDPADSFEFPEDIEAIRNGSIEWFCVTVEVRKNGHVIGSDHLGGCAYKTVSEFFEGHRDANPLNRNSSIMRAALGHNTSLGHYFPSMVSEAIADARRTLDTREAAKANRSKRA
jgi:hypothetical protein